MPCATTYAIRVRRVVASRAPGRRSRASSGRAGAVADDSAPPPGPVSTSGAARQARSNTDSAAPAGSRAGRVAGSVHARGEVTRWSSPAAVTLPTQARPDGRRGRRQAECTGVRGDDGRLPGRLELGQRTQGVADERAVDGPFVRIFQRGGAHLLPQLREDVEGPLDPVVEGGCRLLVVTTELRHRHGQAGEGV